MKRFLSGLVICIMALGFIVCDNGGGDTHSHSFSSEWSSDYSQHWKGCDCGAKSQVANHSSQKPCTTCGYVIVPTFFWGNYIPEKVRAPSQMGSAGKYFSIDELVNNVANARKKHELDWDAIDWGDWDYEDPDTIIVNSNGTKYVLDSSGNKEVAPQEPPVGDLIWQEKKSNEPANKADKSINWIAQTGFLYFVSPANFGELNISQGGLQQFPPAGTWTKYTATIDNLEYYIHVLGLQTSAFTATTDFKFI